MIYPVETSGAKGRYQVQLGSDIASATVSGLKIGQPYRFIVISGQLGADGSSFQWFQQSNWAPALPVLPTPPPAPRVSLTPTPAATPTPTSDATGYEYVEIESFVVPINPPANTFTARGVECEHFGGQRPPNPVTVDYSAVAYVENWLHMSSYLCGQLSISKQKAATTRPPGSCIPTKWNVKTMMSVMTTTDDLRGVNRK